MNKIVGFEEAPAYTGESSALPAGKYICVIKSAKEVQTQNKKGQLAILLDIAEGQYKGYYETKYKSDVERNSTNAKWGCVFRQGYEDRQLPFFKGMITSIEESNTGYKWDWDESKLKGKRVGVVFGREQFKASDGSLKFATKPLKVRSIQRLEQAEIPADKLLQSNETSNMWGQQGFTDLDGNEDDLPF